MITSAKTGAANFLNAANTRAIARGLIIVSLLVRNFDFDKFRSLLKDQAATDVEPFPNILASVCAFVSLFAGPLASPELKSIALQALEAAISSEPNKTVDIKVLIGNADEMADAGVSSAVMQMYLSYILEGLMSVDKTLNTTAFDAICIIIEQGLAHPLLCVPYVVAMQTSPVPSVRDRAVLVYDNLAEKHQTFIHSRTGECVRKAFEYRMSLAQAVTATLPANVAPALVWADGYHIHAKVVSVSDDGAAYQRGGVVAFLENMYAKIQVKRQRRNEFLTTLVRSFDVDFSSTNEDKNVIPFARFTAETLAALNYKSVDEVMIIIHHIYQILSVSGETILKFIEDLKAGLYENDEELLKLNAKASVLMGILVMLKSFFLKLYGLSDSKCRLFAPADASSRNTEKLRPAIVNSSAETLISWKRWPYADTQKLSTIEDMKKQLDLFSELMDSDYYVRGSGENSSDNEDEFDARVELSSDHSGNESPTRESVLAPAVIAVKGKKRASISGNPTAKKARRTSMKGPLKRGSPEYEGQAERPKRAHSRASIIELSSDDGED
ncbi:Sister chromatid cohesion protein 2 [Physocladia obscura]|uniref:Sister chromatid cohesion protein n=1 Tax=Physocladia obscura TaxID=109957 RepID=A0AAD5XC14_9FUNG|nr:Sister chromatid cohesion protein 2 [Physocladia obscura]